MPQASASNGDNNQGGMEQSMKMMNNVMPIMSAFFCLSFSIGIGIYWIAGAVIRCIQQVIINRQMAKVDMNELIEKNQEKLNKKRKKAGLPPQKITQQAKMNVRNIEEPKEEKKQEQKEKTVKDSTEYYKNSTNYKSGSLASKANMVRQFEDKKKKK